MYRTFFDELWLIVSSYLAKSFGFAQDKLGSVSRSFGMQTSAGIGDGGRRWAVRLDVGVEGVLC